ncbi:MerR family DNA-binding transcriptional regulator [Lactobacillus curvatus]|nr:MerR family DNA-binding transcriptional regulator [Latilactobacillus curvatus]MSE24220.1 MerR family DNA-binding transcriptional regulator [Latilactobacillus curvatus]
MNIKEAAKLTDLTSNTIRYYERIGVVPAIPRDQNGNRIFGNLEIQWLEFSRDLRHAGVHVETIIDYVQLVAQGDRKIPARVNLLEETKAEIEDTIAELTATLEHLQYKIDHYDTHMVNLENKLTNESRKN